MTSSIGRRVAYYRRERQMTAQDLANQCSALGLPIHRAVIAKLERGLREHITVPELLVLAKALNVAPAQLVFPVGLEDKTEVVPGTVDHPWRAVWWLAGIDPGDNDEDSLNFLPLFYEHQRAWETYMEARMELRDSGDPGLTAVVKRARDELRRGRDAIRNRGLIPPPLPAETAAALDEEPVTP